MSSFWTFLTGLFHSFAFLTTIAVIFGIAGIGLVIYAFVRRRRYPGTETGAKTMIICGFALIAAILAIWATHGAISARAIEPPPEEPVVEEPQYDENAFPVLSLSREQLDKRFVDVEHYLSTASMSSETTARLASVKEATGTQFSDAVEYALVTNKRVEEIRKMKDGEGKTAALVELLNEVQENIIRNPVMGLMALEWLQSEPYFTTNNPWITELYDEIVTALEDPTPDERGAIGWLKFFDQEVRNGETWWRHSDDLWYEFAKVAVVFDYAEIRGIEKLMSTKNWHLPEGQDDDFIRAKLNDEQEGMYSLILSFAHKPQEDGVPVPKYLVGFNTADQRLEIFELTAKEEPEKPAPKAPSTPNENPPKKPPATVTVPQDPVVTDPQPEYHRVIEHFVDLKGNRIADSVTQKQAVLTGDKWSSSYNRSLEDKGYTLVETTTNNGGRWRGRDAKKVSGTMPNYDLEVTYHYKLEKEYNVLIKYMNRETEKEFTDLRVDKDFANGESYEFVSPTSKEMQKLGYGYFSEPSIKVVKGKIDGKNVEATVWYTPLKEATVTIHFKTDDGDYLGRDTQTGKIGTSTTYISPQFDGWQPHELSIQITFEPGNEYTIWYYKLPPDGQGAKNPADSSSKNPNTDDGNGKNTPSSDHTSRPQGTNPPEYAPPSGTTSNDSSGTSGAGSQSTTNHDTTGTGSDSNPTIKDQDGGQVSGGTAPSPDENLSNLPSSSVGTTETRPNDSGGSSSVTTITPSDDGGLISGNVSDNS